MAKRSKSYPQTKGVRFPEEIRELVEHERALLRRELPGVRVSFAAALFSLVRRGSLSPPTSPTGGAWRDKLGR